jgi:hypothetical protein
MTLRTIHRPLFANQAYATRLIASVALRRKMMLCAVGALMNRRVFSRASS